MNGTDVDFAAVVERRTGVEKTGLETKEFPALFVKSIDKAKRQITALASSADLDRHDEVVEPEAFRELLPVYMKSGGPVITSHQHRLETGHSSLIGNVIKAWIDQQGLWVTIEFIRGTALGEEYGMLYLEKKQRALSIGFIELEGGSEMRDGRQVYIHTKVELLEISCVIVGANREALSKSKQRKVDFVSEKKTLAEIRHSNPNFDQECREFAEMISGYDMTENETDFTELVIAENETDFAELVRG